MIVIRILGSISIPKWLPCSWPNVPRLHGTTNRDFRNYRGGAPFWGVPAIRILVFWGGIFRGYIRGTPYIFANPRMNFTKNAPGRVRTP